jgi:hypothetical protein
VLVSRVQFEEVEAPNSADFLENPKDHRTFENSNLPITTNPPEVPRHQEIHEERLVLGTNLTLSLFLVLNNELFLFFALSFDLSFDLADVFFNISNRGYLSALLGLFVERLLIIDAVGVNTLCGHRERVSKKGSELSLKTTLDVLSLKSGIFRTHDDNHLVLELSPFLSLVCLELHLLAVLVM